jgi:hypothetical protein
MTILLVWVGGERAKAKAKAQAQAKAKAKASASASASASANTRVLRVAQNDGVRQASETSHDKRALRLR